MGQGFAEKGCICPGWHYEPQELREPQIPAAEHLTPESRQQPRADRRRHVKLPIAVQDQINGWRRCVRKKYELLLGPVCLHIH
ncbi:unnamed protein product [Caenorhabditis auriculariae]|uniref:Uncharacterized protein n=1 Tax=Caenorhabditis auriculariae TaxID=2777116 RepID=A0A8S1H5I7_9PELO|nr:unnamed protein product [Caenorhabditis auriculariae]